MATGAADSRHHEKESAWRYGEVAAQLVRRLGPRRLRAVLAAMELRGLSVYSGPPPPPGHAIRTSLA
jgi:hypothetical protein